jgi:hypothetical protein
MKKIIALLILASAFGLGQDAKPAPQAASLPAEQTGRVAKFQAPTPADLSCAGFLSPIVQAGTGIVAGGVEAPATTRFSGRDLVYLTGQGYRVGERYAVVRELRDPNRRELVKGQQKEISKAGHPYAELGDVRVMDTRGQLTVAQVEFACDAMTMGDVVVPYTERPVLPARPPGKVDLFSPPTGRLAATIVLTKDFDSEVGTGAKVYLNAGSNQGVKTGDYLRVLRSPAALLADPVDALSFRATNADDTQRHPAAVEPGWLQFPKHPRVEVRQYPTRVVGELVVLGVTPVSSTGMVVFATEEIHVGDAVDVEP